MKGLAVLPISMLETADSDPVLLAARAGADVILRGTIQFEGERARVTYSLLDERGVQLAAGSSEGSTARMLDLQDQVAGRAVRDLGLASSGTISADDRNFPQDRYLEALGHLRRYENEASVDAAIRILEKLGSSPAVRGARARAYLAKYSIDSDRTWAEKAIEESQRAAEVDPDRYEVRETMGRIHLLLNRPDEALEDFRHALRLHPESVDAQLGLAKAFEKEGRTDEAENAYQRAVEMQPRWWATHNHLGVFYLMHGRFEEAANAFQEAIRLSPDNVRAINNLAIAWHQLGRYDDAIAEYERAIEIRPEPDALSNLGTCLYALGRFDEAAEAYERASGLSPDSATLWFNLGDALRRTDGGAPRADESYRKAIAILLKDLEVTPRDADRRMMLALCYARTGQADQARWQMNESLGLEPPNAYIAYQAALVATEIGDVDDAIGHVEAAIRNGYPAEQAAVDPDFARLKSDPRFATIVRPH